LFFDHFFSPHTFFCTMSITVEPYLVKDINLHEFGRKEMDLAEFEMPGLMQTRLKYNDKPFKVCLRAMFAN